MTTAQHLFEVMFMGRPYKCRYCGSTDTIWKGYRMLTAGRVRLRKCKACGRKFTTGRKEGG